MVDLAAVPVAEKRAIVLDHGRERSPVSCRLAVADGTIVDGVNCCELQGAAASSLKSRVGVRQETVAERAHRVRLECHREVAQAKHRVGRKGAAK